MIIDIYTHIFPPGFYDRMTAAAPNLADIGKRMQSVTLLHDLEARFRLMDEFGEYRQIVSLPNPPLEAIAAPAVGMELARIANDLMAELVARHPDRFPGFVAALSMNDMDASMVELHRAIRDLGAKGVLIYTNVNGHPLDEPQFAPLFAAMADYDLPIWLHPTRTAEFTDYAAEPRSRFEMWWCFGWPYDTSVAMARLVFSGLFDRHPGIKILTHHLGGMVPYFDGRVGPGLEVLGSRTTAEDYSGVLAGLKRPHMDYFRMFYGDTAMFGSATALRCGIEFFGNDQVVFATDCPFAPVRETVAAVESLGLAGAEHRKMFQANAERLMRTSFA